MLRHKNDKITAGDTAPLNETRVTIIMVARYMYSQEINNNDRYQDEAIYVT